MYGCRVGRVLWINKGGEEGARKKPTQIVRGRVQHNREEIRYRKILLASFVCRFFMKLNKVEWW